MGWDDFVVPGETFVVEALAEKDDVCYGVVDSEDYLYHVSSFF